MNDFIPIEDIDYPKAKMSRPTIILHSGKVLKYCFPNAGIWKGYDANYNRQSAEFEDIKYVKYNSWSEWLEWQRKHWDRIYE